MHQYLLLENVVRFNLEMNASSNSKCLLITLSTLYYVQIKLTYLLVLHNSIECELPIRRPYKQFAHTFKIKPLGSVFCLLALV